MTPIDFAERNIVIGKDQPEYLPLPAYKDESGETISCWQLSWRETWKLLFTRKLWLRQMTFGRLLQPQLPTVDTPFVSRP